MCERIVSDPRILVGKPVIAGTRIPVALILNLMAHGYDVDRILAAYPALTAADVKAALLYAADALPGGTEHQVAQTS
jgi:uncharacterized protein (DUF433 family)